jgi:signal peptidase I
MSSGTAQEPPPEDPSSHGAEARSTATGTVSAVTTDDRVAPAPSEEPEAQPDQEEVMGTRVQRRDARKQGPLGFLRELPALLLVAFLLALLIKTFLVQAFYIPSASMEPTLQIGDRVLVNKVVYHIRPLGRGDIIVFTDPHPIAQPHRSPLSGFWHWLTEGLGVSTNPDKDFIKRVIGLPGDTVQIRRGQVMVNGLALKEPYLSPIKDFRDYGPVKVPADNLFVLGDNRTNSNDSRFTLGFVPSRKVVGRAFVIIWPPSRIRWLH